MRRQQGSNAFEVTNSSACLDDSPASNNALDDLDRRIDDAIASPGNAWTLARGRGFDWPANPAMECDETFRETVIGVVIEDGWTIRSIEPMPNP